MKQGLLYRYRDYLPVTKNTPLITLGEGDTPLVRSLTLEKELNCGELYFKLEGCNPSGSFKDRGMVMAIANAVENGNKTVICASTGNTSASAAAYGARFGLSVVVIIPKGKIALGKLAQAIAYGARIIAIDGNFDQALQIVLELVNKYPIALVNSLNPYRIEGQKTGAFEIIDELGDAPDYQFMPVGNAGNITAYWKGYVEYMQAKKSSTLRLANQTTPPLIMSARPGSMLSGRVKHATRLHPGFPSCGRHLLNPRVANGVLSSIQRKWLSAQGVSQTCSSQPWH